MQLLHSFLRVGSTGIFIPCSLLRKNENDGRIQPLLFERRVDNLVLSPTQSNVVEADDIEGWINKSRVKRKYVNMQQLLAARDGPIDAWVDTFHFTYNGRELLQRLPTMSAYVTIVSGDRRQCLGIQRSASSFISDHVEVSNRKSRFYCLIFVFRVLSISTAV